MPSVSLPGFWGSNAVLRFAQWALYWAVALVPMQYFSVLNKHLWGVFNCSLMCYAAAVYYVCVRWRQQTEVNSQELALSFHCGFWGLSSGFQDCSASASTNRAIFPVLFNIFYYFPHLNLNSLLLVNMSVLFIQFSTPQNKYWANETMILNPTWWFSTETSLPPRWHVTCLKWILTVTTLTGNGLEHATDI